MNLLLLFLLVNSVAAGLYGRIKDVALASPAAVVTQNTDVAIKNVLDVVNLVQELPPCNKIATSMLMHTCVSSLDSTGNALESLSTIYGTRLAVCELYNAGADIPAACAKFVPSPEMFGRITAKGSIRNGIMTDPHFAYNAYDASTAATSKKCTKALFGKPQSWTSFSNSRQNSLAICQAMRAEIDKDQLIGILAEVKHQSQEFRQASLNSMEVLRQLHEFAVKTYQQNLASQVVISDTSVSLANSLSVTNSDVVSLLSFVTETSMAMQTFRDDIQSSLLVVAARITNLTGDVVEAHQAMVGFSEELGVVNNKVNTARQSVLLLEKTAASTAEDLNEKFHALHDKADAVNTAFDGILDPMLSVMSIISRMARVATKVATLVAIFLGAFGLAFPLCRARAGASKGTAFSVAAGIGFSYATLYAMVVESGLAAASPLAALVISLAIVAAGLGFVSSIPKGPKNGGEEDDGEGGDDEGDDEGEEDSDDDDGDYEVEDVEDGAEDYEDDDEDDDDDDDDEEGSEKPTES